MIPQHGFVFKGTLQENLDPEDRFKENDLKKIILKSGLSLRNYFGRKNMEEDNDIDLNFIIQTSGKNLSNGEIQIINYLRTLVYNQKILCLDEATSNLDSQTGKNKTIFKK